MNITIFVTIKVDLVHALYAFKHTLLDDLAFIVVSRQEMEKLKSLSLISSVISVMIILKRYYFETDDTFKTIISDLSITMESSGGTVIYLTHHCTPGLDALEEAIVFMDDMLHPCLGTCNMFK